MELNRWRILLFGLVLVSLVITTAVAVFNWDPLLPMRSNPRWGGEHFLSDESKVPSILSVAGGLVTLFLTGVMGLFLFPRRVRVMGTALDAPFTLWLRVTGMGLLGILLAVLMAGGSTLAIGIFPLALLLAFGIFLFALVGALAFIYWLGRTLLQRSGLKTVTPYARLLVGLVILYPPLYLPVAGAVIGLIYICIGLGLAIATRFGSNQPWSLKSLLEEG